jgi:hypothetical protein
MTTAVAIIYALIVAPSAPLVIGWGRIIRNRHAHNATGPVASLAVATLSYTWLLLVLLCGPRIAPDYSNLRFGTIWGNLGVVLIALVLAASIRRWRRGSTLAALALLVVLWTYAWVISAVV